MNDKQRKIIWACGWICLLISWVIFAKTFVDNKIILIAYVLSMGIPLIAILETTAVIQNE